MAADIHSHPGSGDADLGPSGNDIVRTNIFIRKNPSAKVQIYAPNMTDSYKRMLDVVNNKWILDF